MGASGPTAATEVRAAVDPTYVELHCHSCYSLREGASTPVELLERAAALGYDALALTDHDGLYGAMEFAREAALRGIHPITGVELTLPDGHHLTLLAESARGYANLCRLITALRTSTASPPGGPATAGVAFPLPVQDPRELSGLIALSGCSRHGEVSSLVQAGRLAEAEIAARRYRDWFGPRNFFIELQHNRVYGDSARIAALVALAERLGVGVVATTNVHYHVRERSRLHDVLIAVRHRTTLDASHHLRRANAEFFLKAPDEVAERFRAHPQAVRASRAIAERCLAFHLYRDLRTSFPDYPTPDGHTPESYLAALCRAALPRAYGPGEHTLRQEAEARLAEELALIYRHGLAGFFLTYRDLLLLATEVAQELRGRDPTLPPHVRPVGRGRGSSVSSLVCYLIGLSHVDPVRNRLFLGRFLNEELASVPDIDLDFPRDIRAALIARLYQRYPGRVGLVCTFATYRLRSAVRDVGRALGLPAAELERLARLSEPRAPADRLAEEMGRLPGFAERVQAPGWRELVALAGELSGFPHHVSQHVGGMVLSAGPLTEVVPLEPAAMPGRWLIQWDKDAVADARLVKIDLLALGMLSVVDECLELVEARHGRRPDFSRLGYEDPVVYDRIGAADTVGVFQLESRAQIQTLPLTQPRTLDDLAAQVAIVRPGPIQGGAFRPFMAYRRRLAAGEPVRVHYHHPLLQPVLAETLGVILYQEQVLQVAMAVAGYTAGQAEALRRALSRRRAREALAVHWPRFRDGAVARGVSVDTTRRIFQNLLDFAAYGFPKSHALAFARLAYESAWLRHYYPAEYYCALFNQQPMGFYPPAVLVGDARRHGIAILAPDVNRSDVRATAEGDSGVRLGLASVRGLSRETAAAVVAERAAGGPFRSLFDLLQRTGLAPAAVGRLILAGACDGFGLERRELWWQLGLLTGGAAWGQGFGRGRANRRRRPRHGALPLAVAQDMVALRPFSAWERLLAEQVTLGLSPTLHPLGLLRRWLGEGVSCSRHVERLPGGARIRLAGLVVCRQRPESARGVLFLLLEDEYGLVNVVVSPALYERQRAVLRGEPLLLVDGVVQRRGASVSVRAAAIAPLRLHFPFPGKGLRPAGRAGR